jgi:hypothetical protein
VIVIEGVMTVAKDDPMVVRSPIGIEILVYREADGNLWGW